MRGVLRERIIRVLLNTPDGSFTKYRVAKEAQVSTNWTVEYLEKLKVMGLVEGTTVLDLHQLLAFWAKISKKPKRFDFFHSDPEKILRSIPCEYALTTYHAENLLHHYLFPSRTDVYVNPNDFSIWKKAIIKEGLVGKGNLRLIISDSHVLYRKQKIKGLWTVSIPQLLLDLWLEGGVAQEAYEMVVKQYVRRCRNENLRGAPH